MKRGLELIAGVPIALVASFYISMRVVQPPNTATVVATLKQDKAAQSARGRRGNSHTGIAQSGVFSETG